MEVCGTHTMSIAKAGIKNVLPDGVNLISGPGCPVCVTPTGAIDEILKLSENENVIIATYGDMIKVPGSTKGDNLARRMSLGAKVEIVYSSFDAVKLAKENPEKDIVFLGIGFETTAPGTAAAIKIAKEEGLKNFYVLSLLKLVEPALRTLIKDSEFNVQGFLCPGHVAVIIGTDGFEFLANEYKIPSVVAGFEPKEILDAIKMLLSQIKNGEAKIENAYEKIVRKEGNLSAMQTLKEIFEPQDCLWRGLGEIPKSGLKIKEEYAEYDATKKFGIEIKDVKQSSLCRCEDIICGKATPKDCPAFGTLCTPTDPEGPCMVSSEGACAAAYKYQL